MSVREQLCGFERQSEAGDADVVDLSTRDQSDSRESEVAEDLRADADLVPRRTARLFLRRRVRVRQCLERYADETTAQIDENAAAELRDPLERQIDQARWVIALSAEYVFDELFPMDAHGNGTIAFHVTEHEREMLRVLELGLVCDCARTT